MFFIAVSWLYIFLASALVGLFIQQKLKLPFQALVIQCLGWFGIALLASIYALFFPLNGIFHLVLLSFVFVSGFIYKKEFLKLIQDLWKLFKHLKIGFKVFIGIISVLILAKCASAPYILDNESYYIQTIKWLNEHGFVKGLANLHLFLGQTSGWHILQAAFNFDFLYANFNDLSGYCLLWGNLYSVKLLNDYFKNPRQKSLLFFAAFPLLNVFYFSFIAAPSPDIPVYVISWYVFYLVFTHFEQISPKLLISICLLIYFLIFIKLTNAFLLLLPLFFFVQNFKRHQPVIPLFLISGVSTLVIICLKNIMVTGVPLYPISLFGSLFSFDYVLPAELQKFYYHTTQAFAYKLSPNQYAELNAWQLFWHWLSLPKLHGFFNKFVIVLSAVTPLFITKIAKIELKKSSWFLYIIGIFQLIILGLTSPQYRFFLSIIFLFISLISLYFLQHKKLISSLMVLSLIGVMIHTFFSFSLNSFTNNPFATQSSSFQLKQIVFPHKNSRYSFDYEHLFLDNLDYHSPKKNDFFWNTGDGPLPTVNKDQIHYFKDNFRYIPQQRGKDLKEGFYSKKLPVE
ncbi:LIC_10190 family membrane protein [Mesonia ostreae]|uniref:DUF8201 domain-containing protein n=1 Tax=Mesonia ostreae TaxID=861110 RepID=A0ABU2KEI1_9FLAO|nr:hypothetical protein [Mesonia ostreae]MDT0293078.1 hypothetical protein [Mesonia ostreae]